MNFGLGIYSIRFHKFAKDLPTQYIRFSNELFRPRMDPKVYHRPYNVWVSSSNSNTVFYINSSKQSQPNFSHKSQYYPYSKHSFLNFQQSHWYQKILFIFLILIKFLCRGIFQTLFVANLSYDTFRNLKYVQLSKGNQ